MSIAMKSVLLIGCFPSYHTEPMNVCLLLLTLFVLLYYWYRRQADAPPGPRGLPFIGVAHMLANDPHITLHEWSKSYGPVMSVRVGRSDWIVLNDAEVVKEAFIKQRKKLSDRPPNYFTDRILSKGGRGIIFGGGADWKILKRFGTTALHQVESGKKFYEEVIQTEIIFFTEKLSQFEGKPINLSSHLMGATANVISTILHGHRMDYTTPEFTDLCDITRKFVLDPHRTKLANAIIFCPTLRHLPIFRDIVSQSIANTKCMEEYMESKLLHRHENPSEIDLFKDCADIFFEEKYGKCNPSVFNDVNFSYFARDMLLAGTETTTTTILWCILALVRDSDLQTEVQEEIENSFQPSCPNISDYRQSMPLTLSFLEEIHRYCTTAPLALPHFANAEASVGDYKIKNGSIVIANLWGVHRDPKVFKNPEKFDPKRFLDADGQFQKSPNVIPFSTGGRSCLGEKLAKTEIFVFLCSILNKFTILPADKSSLPSLSDGVFSTVHMPKPFQVILNKR